MKHTNKVERIHISTELLVLGILSNLLCSTIGSQAFLFHQMQPMTASSLSSTYYNENSSSQNRASVGDQSQFQTSSSHSFSNDAISQVQPRSDEQSKLNGCPVECQCSKVAQIADCSNRNLQRVPTGFSQEIKRIRLEHNNITELGPYSFQGLKRLQRIDLSNNNLQKIDPLAFSGGLQSLNSLILYSNKISQLPVNVFSELSQLQLLLLNANALQCVNKDLFQPLTNLNLLSLYDNGIETITNGTFEGLKNIKTIHLGKNPLICDCNLRWLADYLESNPVETSEARCEGPPRNQGKRLSQLNKQKFKCEGKEQSKTNQLANQCNFNDQSCPAGCVCNGSSIDCSRVSQSESRTSGGIYELPDLPDDIPVYVTKLRINDTRIKRIRQTGLFRRLANSQRLDLGNNKIIDIEDNAINGAGGSTKPERIVFVLIENDHCEASNGNKAPSQPEDACSSAPRVNPPTYDSPCYNGGSCIVGARSTPSATNYTCLCPPGFAGPLCEINIDDCVDHECQNGALCVDGINSYRCVCRDPTTSGEFCEQLNSFASNGANSIAPIALPMIASIGQQQQQQSQTSTTGTMTSTEPVIPKPTEAPQILARSADMKHSKLDLKNRFDGNPGPRQCKRITQRKVLDDGNGCRSAKPMKMGECVGVCGREGNGNCCEAMKIKRRRVRMVCNDGASYIKTVDQIRTCGCSNECSDPFSNIFINAVLPGANRTSVHDDQLLQITRIDAVD